MSQVESFDRESERIAKFKRELAHFTYLKEKGYNSLEIADKLIHGMLETLKWGVQSRYPDADAEEIRKKLMEIALRDLRLKKIARLKKNV